MRKLILILPLTIAINAFADIRVWTSVHAYTGTGRTNSGTGVANPGRAGFDSLCNFDPNKPSIPGSTTRALISVNSTDEIRDMQANYSIPSSDTIFRADGTTQIASNFNALLNTGVLSLNNPISGPTNVWTGSSDSGELNAALHCVNWTDENAINQGRLGNATQIDSNYLNTNQSACNLTNHLYCITYVLPPVPPSSNPTVPNISTVTID